MITSNSTIETGLFFVEVRQARHGQSNQPVRILRALFRGECAARQRRGVRERLLDLGRVKVNFTL
jgi:hypothetical protein